MNIRTIPAITMSTLWRKQYSVPKPLPSPQYRKHNKDTLKLTTASVTAQCIRLVKSDITDMQAALEEGLVGAAAELNRLLKRLKTLQNDGYAI